MHRTASTRLRAPGGVSRGSTPAPGRRRQAETSPPRAARTRSRGGAAGLFSDERHEHKSPVPLHRCVIPTFRQPLAMASVPAWKAALQQSIADNASIRESLYLALATVRPDGTPAVRTIVYRGFGGSESNDILFTTDTRCAFDCLFAGESGVGGDGGNGRDRGGSGTRTWQLPKVWPSSCVRKCARRALRVRR